MILRIVPEYHDSDSSSIVIECMYADTIVPTSSSLIYLSSLSDDIVVGDISPLFGESMGSIDTTDDLLICLSSIEVDSLMMDDDARDLLDSFDRIDEWMTIFAILEAHDLPCRAKYIFYESDSRVLSLERIELYLCFRSSDVLEISRIDTLPLWAISISESLICSPSDSRDDIYIQSRC